jgi:hypothetical protein
MEYSALHLTFLPVSLPLPVNLRPYAKRMLSSYNMSLAIFEVVIFPVQSCLEHVITKLLAVFLVFDGFSKKEILPPQCLQLLPEAAKQV